MKILITGVAGFIGFHFTKILLKYHYEIIGIDSINDYYDIQLKLSRLEILKKLGLEFYKIDISNKKDLENCIAKIRPNTIVNLAAQAGVRYSITNPNAYISSNINGFINILECCKKFGTKHLIYASSSSVYGANQKIPFSETDNVDNSLSLYAATKKSNELMAHAYSHLNNLPCTGLRFFTVYGPWGRPDMAYFKFVDRIVNDKPIDIYGHGKMTRDFTFINDVVNAMKDILNIIPQPTQDNQKIPYEIYNIGNNKPEKLEYFISTIENILDKKAIRNYLPMQDGDVINTFANIDKIKSKINFVHKTNINQGLKKFIEWYLLYYKK